MNTFDESYLYGLLSGLLLYGFGSLLLRICREEAALPILSKDSPFEPTWDSELRLLRICGGCHRHMGEDRTIKSGQHLAILNDTCPRCAKRRALENLTPETA